MVDSVSWGVCREGRGGQSWEFFKDLLEGVRGRAGMVEEKPWRKVSEWGHRRATTIG